MTSAVIRLWLKVMDPTALTARETLQRALGYGRRVRDVARSEVLAADSFTLKSGLSTCAPH